MNGKDIVLNIILKEEFNQVNAVTITAGAFEAGDKKRTVSLNSIDQIVKILFFTAQ